MVAVAVVGLGYVGLTTAACLAELGHQVVGLDIDRTRVEALYEGRLPIFEPGLEALLRNPQLAGRISFDTEASVVSSVDVIFLCLPTPTSDDGNADLSHFWGALGAMQPHLHSGQALVIKSTVPVGTSRKVAEQFDGLSLRVVSNPEFLREGKAVQDLLHPDRIVIGTDWLPDAKLVRSLYEDVDAQVFVMGWEAAELVKHASNAYLATRLSFVNEIAALSVAVGADPAQVLRGMGADSRIGTAFLDPGPGWGGSCFPKDTRALVSIGKANGVTLGIAEQAITANERQLDRVGRLVLDALDGNLEDKIVALFGLAFKAGTDDTRGSPSLRIAERLAAVGVRLRAYDPVAKLEDPNILQCASALAAADGADAVVVMTEWEEFTDLDLAEIAVAMRGRILVDTRGVVDPDAARSVGLRYLSTCRI